MIFLFHIYSPLPVEESVISTFIFVPLDLRHRRWCHCWHQHLFGSKFSYYWNNLSFHRTPVLMVFTHFFETLSFLFLVCVAKICKWMAWV